jgi:hypothetical protein
MRRTTDEARQRDATRGRRADYIDRDGGLSMIGRTIELVPGCKRYEGGPAEVVGYDPNLKVRKYTVRRTGQSRTFRVDPGEFDLPEEAT